MLRAVDLPPATPDQPKVGPAAHILKSGSLGDHNKCRDMKTYLYQSDILILSGRDNTTNLLPTQDIQ